MNTIEEVLLRKYNEHINRFKNSGKAIGSLEIELKSSLNDDVIDTEGFKFIVKSVLGKSSHLFASGELIRAAFYENNDNEFLAFQVNYLGSNRLRYKVITNSQEYVDRSLESDYKYPKIIWD